MEKKSDSHFMYIVKCSDGTFYTGYTTDLDRRIQMHNNGTGAKYTRARGPVELLYAKEYDTKRVAMQEETRFKRLNRTQKEAFLNENAIDFHGVIKPVIDYLALDEKGASE